ncbi:MAG: PP2C family protein-serine/threonine phosphatase [Bacteroidales bacterium]
MIGKLNTVVNDTAGGERFITFFVARYDQETGVLEYINAAHNPPVCYDTITGELIHLQTLCVGIGMLDKIPPVVTEKIRIKNYSKIVCYTDGLSDLPGEDGREIGTKEIIRFIKNPDHAEKNILKMLKHLGIPDNNPHLFDDVSIIAIDLFR